MPANTNPMTPDKKAIERSYRNKRSKENDETGFKAHRERKKRQGNGKEGEANGRQQIRQRVVLLLVLSTENLLIRIHRDDTGRREICMGWGLL